MGGRFDLTDIPPAQRGIPQIEVTFDIDANGILKVKAKDKTTGKEQKIVIQASSGLSENDIENMLKNAEESEEIDKEFNELIKTKNKADNLIHNANKNLKNLKNLTKEEENKIKSKITNLEKSIKDDKKIEIIENTKLLEES